jgi:phosphoglucomutase/phosphomannomutase
MNALEITCQRLIAKDPSLGATAAANLRAWLADEVPLAQSASIAAHLCAQPDAARINLIFDAFWQVLPIGTGGRRGRVGYGPNRLNPTTVALTVQGQCDYLKRALPDQQIRVVVANDVRVFNDIAGTYDFLPADHPLIGMSSRSLAKLACQVYAANGITAYLTTPDAESAVLATPELSFAIDALKADAGLNISASHNPPDDNGIKIYDGDGSQPVPPDDQAIVSVINEVKDVQIMPYAEARADGLIQAIPEHLHDDYLQTYVRAFHGSPTDVPIVFSPLCGCGNSTAGDVLRTIGFPVLTPPDQEADGSFASIPFKAPNPEVAAATLPAQAYANGRAAIVLSSDPDADRCGLDIQLQDGSWFHCDGNQIAAIVAYYLMVDPQGPQRRGLLIETVVTTRILSAIAARLGTPIVDDLLVGFKYISNVVKNLGPGQEYAHLDCQPDDLVFAAEESHGVMTIPTIRDKDATPACVYLAALHQRLHAEGRTLLDYYCDILTDLGAYDNVNRSIVMAGADGLRQKDAIMATLRTSQYSDFAGLTVTNSVDWWDEQRYGPFKSDTDRASRNVLRFDTPQATLIVRPSGTEPKLKFYIHLLPDAVSGEPDFGKVRRVAEDIAARVYNAVLALIDCSLSPAALCLPDIVPLPAKLAFDAELLPALPARLQGDSLPDLLAWLADSCAAMTPGTDPLPALKAALTEALKPADSAPMLEPIRSWCQA